MRADLLLSALQPTVPIPPHVITHVTESAARADGESVFVCIRGARADGHDFAAEAYAKGCRFFVAERALALPPDAAVLVCGDSRRALGRLACNLMGDPSHRMQLIAVTGTKGKTTTARLIAQIAAHAGVPCGYIGTNGIRYADVSLPSINTTPDAVTLQRTLCDMLARGVQTAVLEVSSQALMQHRAEGMRFSTVLFTNLFPDHIGVNEHPDFESYRDAKHTLFTDYAADVMIVNADDPHAEEMRRNASASRCITCSAEGSADYTAREIAPLLADGQAHGVALTLGHGKETQRLSLPMPGVANARNALLAAASANAVLGISLRCCADALQTAAVEGRSEMLPLPNGATVVIDYAHNGESLSQLLRALREYRPRRLICLFGSIGERAQMRRAELGEAAAAHADLLFLTSDNPGREDPEAILDEIERAVRLTNTPYRRITDRTEAIRAALATTDRGDILVLAGKGHEREQLIGDARLPFSERALVEEFSASIPTAALS